MPTSPLLGAAADGVVVLDLAEGSDTARSRARVDALVVDACLGVGAVVVEGALGLAPPVDGVALEAGDARADGVAKVVDGAVRVGGARVGVARVDGLDRVAPLVRVALV